MSYNVREEKKAILDSVNAMADEMIDLLSILTEKDNEINSLTDCLDSRDHYISDIEGEIIHYQEDIIELKRQIEIRDII
jgi:uncharacterized protein YdcH (DUF465 family)